MSACGKVAQDLLFTVGAGQVPHLCCPAHSPWAWSQGCFRFCPHTGLGGHTGEVKLIVSLINLLPQHLLKGFTAC